MIAPSAPRDSCCNLWGSPRTCSKRLLLSEAAAATSGAPPGLAASVFFFERQLLQPLGGPQDLQQASFAFRGNCCNLWGSPRTCSKRLLLSRAPVVCARAVQARVRARARARERSPISRHCPRKIQIFTVAILAQGTSWADAATQAFLSGVRAPSLALKTFLVVRNIALHASISHHRAANTLC